MLPASPKMSSVAIVALCCLAVFAPKIDATNADTTKLAEKLIDTMKSNHLAKQRLYLGELALPKDPREDERIQAIEQLTSDDIERLGEDISKLPPFDQWLRDKVREINKLAGTICVSKLKMPDIKILKN